MEKTVLIIPNHQSLSFSNSTTFALTSRTSVCKWQCHKHHSLQGLRCVKLGGHICKAKTRAEGYGSTLTTKKADAEEEEDEEEGISASELEALEQEAKSVAKEYELSLVNKLHGDKGLTLQRIKEMQRRYNRSSTDEIPDHLLPKVAILGRPNVGKSALFNRLIGRNIAIVADESGVTRDRLYCRSQWKEKAFIIVDTGGVLALPNSRGVGTDGSADAKSKGEGSFASPTKEKTSIGLTSMVEKQAITAVKDASVIIFVTDGQVGVTAADIEIADWLRKTHSDKKIILAVNKCESPRKGLLQATEFWSFGLTPIPISAISGTGIGELLDLVCTGLRSTEEFEDKNEKEDCAAAIAIVGKPNVGKSSILNALMGEERTIVSPVSGTTRDAIDTKYNGPDGKIYRLIDTAGIRRRAAVASGGSEPESLSVNQAFRAIRRADVVALVIEAMACVTEQDYKIAERIDTEGKGCIIVINKWDTIPNKTNKTTLFYEEDVRAKLRVLSWAPIVYVSALSGSNVKKIITAANAAKNERARRLGTSVLNQVVQDSLAFKLPPMTRGGKRGRVYYCTQAAVCPPTFVFFVNDAKLFPEPYRRYMEKQLRSNIGFPGTPIRLLWRSKKKGENAPKDKEMESTDVSSEQISSPS